MKKLRTNRGIAPLIILLVIAVLAIGGGAVYLKSQDKPISVESARENILGIQKDETLDSLEIDTEGFNFSLSSLPAIEITALNLEIPKMEVPKIGGFNTKLNVISPTIDKNKINISMPSLANITPTISIPSNPTNIPTEAPANLPPIDVPTSHTDGQGSIPSSGGAPQIDCSQFQMVPSCSYVPAGQAQDACKKCFPSK